MSAKQVQVRPMNISDIEGIQAMHKRVSPESLRLRYLGAGTPPSRYFEWVCNNGVGFVAVSDDKIVGMGYYVLENEVSAEVAFLVEDAYQGQRIGSQLFDHLLEAAKDVNLSKLNAICCSDNDRMIRLLQRAGLPTDKFSTQGTSEFKMQLGPEPEPTPVQNAPVAKLPAAPKQPTLWEMFVNRLADWFGLPKVSLEMFG